MRNETVSAEQLAAMAEMAERLQDAANNAMSQAQAQLSEASRQENRRSATEEARAQERAALQRLREMQQDLAKESDRAQARNFAARLRELSGVQRDVEEGLKRAFPQVVGLLPEQVSSRERAILENMAGREAVASRETQRLQGEMKSFAVRMGAEAYDSVVGEMAKAGAVGALEQLGKLVSANRSGTAMGQAAHWAEAFEGWAERLSEAADQMGGGGGGAGGGGSMSPEMMEMLLELARLRQRQAGAQQETRAADEGLKEEQARQRRAAMLGKRQQEIRQKMEEMAQRLPPQAGAMAEAIQQAMADAQASLEQGALGEETTGAQAAAVELLTQLLMSPSMGGGGAGAMMMAMMGSGQSGGSSGSAAGGNASPQPSDLQGEDGGGKAQEVPTGFRGGDRTAGGTATEWPPEYRDALEGFFQGAAREEER